MPGGARGRIRCESDGEFVFAAGGIMVRTGSVLPLRQRHLGTGIACTHRDRAGAWLRAGLTGRNRKTRDAAQQELRAPGGLCGQAEQLSTVQNPGAI